MSTKEIEITYR